MALDASEKGEQKGGCKCMRESKHQAAENRRSSQNMRRKVSCLRWPSVALARAKEREERMGSKGVFYVAVVLLLLCIELPTWAACQQMDSIAGDERVPDDIPKLNCTDNLEVYSLLDFLSGARTGEFERNASTEALVDTWSLADLCSLRGVLCHEDCMAHEDKNLLAPLCAIGNDTSPESLVDAYWKDEKEVEDMMTRSRNLAMTLVSFCVVSLDLGSRGLQGDLESLAGLTGLRRLNLSRNAVTGNVADLSRMKELQFLDLSFNNIGGRLDGFDNPKLETLHAGHNYFIGNMSGLQSLQNLEYLDLNHNGLEGGIEYLSDLDLVQYAYLNENFLTGNISAIQDMNSLLLFAAQNNSLSGTLPESEEMENLIVLMLASNDFTKVGDAFTKMPNLQFADLSANSLSDNVNSVLKSASPWLGAMDLRINNLQGVIETDIANSIQNLEFLFISENPQLKGRLIPNLGNYEQIQVSTIDQFLYYVVDPTVFASFETVQSNYFKVQDDFLATDYECKNYFSEVYSNTTMQTISVDKKVKNLYYCFTMPRGKFLIDKDKQNIIPFNISYFANVESCGIMADQQSGQNQQGYTFLRDYNVPVVLPLSTCDIEGDSFLGSNKISMTLYVHGDYGANVNRGYIQNFNFLVDVTGGKSSFEQNYTPYIIMIILIIMIAVVLTVVIGITVSMYVSLQKQYKYNRMKKSAESAFVKTRKESAIHTDRDSCIVFTDIQSSTCLRDSSSQLYHEIILVHDGLVRKLAARLGGVELATEGDGFVLWFESVPYATIFCMELQQELMHVSWSPKVKKLCNKAYSEAEKRQENVCNISKNSLSSLNSRASMNSQQDCNSLYQKIQKKYEKYIFNQKCDEKCFSGPRVRCGVHVVRSGKNSIENVSLGVYSFSGPDFETGRIICDMGHGGQVLVSGEAQNIILDNLNATQFPQIWHWGGYTFDAEDNKEVHHIYEVAPSQGVIKNRNFEGLRGRIQLAYPPGVRFSSRSPPTENAIIVCATVKESNMGKSAFEMADNLFSDMQQRFWGWRIVHSDLKMLEVQQSKAGKNFSGLSRLSLKRGGSSSPRPTVSFFPSSKDGSTMFSAQENRLNEMTRKWYFTFAKPEDALRFALCCQLELVYAHWPKHIRSRYKQELTAEKAPLWHGLPVAFAVHLCKSPNFELTSNAQLLPTSSIRMRAPSKSNLELCNPNKKHVLYGTQDTLKETVSLLDNVALNGQVVVTSSLIESMTVPIANIGDPVVEHLGKVAIKEFKAPIDVYQILPVELAARTFPSLSETMRSGHVISVGARSAPPAKVGLTFVFVYTICSDDESKAEGNETFSSESVFDPVHLQELLSIFGGYIVDEVSKSNLVFAFSDPTGAICFCSTIQRAMASCKSRLHSKKDEGLEEYLDCAPSDALYAINLLRLDHEHNKSLKIGIASIESQSEVSDVFLGIDSTTGRRRYGTPILNMASRVAKSARVGQILMVGRNPGMRFMNSKSFRMTARAREEMDKVTVIEHGYYKLRGFGEKPRFVYEIQSTEAGSFDLYRHDVPDTDYMQKSAHQGSSFEILTSRSASTRLRSSTLSRKASKSSGISSLGCTPRSLTMTPRKK